MSDNNENKSAETVTPQSVAAVVESILFAAGYPIESEKLRNVIGCDSSLFDSGIDILNEKYSTGGIKFLKLNDSYQLCTSEKYSEYIKTALDARGGGNLSRASLEVLAIIAYNEPVTRSYIDTVRGVDSGYTVTNLHEKGLIEQCGQLDAPGKPTLWKTTADFLRVFGISSIYELPPFELPCGDGQVIIKPWGTPSENGDTAE